MKIEELIGHRNLEKKKKTDFRRNGGRLIHSYSLDGGESEFGENPKGSSYFFFF